MSDVFLYWGMLAAIFLFAILPGYLFSCLFKELNQLERFSVSFGFSFLFIVSLSPLLALHLHAVFRGAFFLGLVLAILAFLYLWRKQGLSIHQEFRFLLGVFVAQLVLKSFIQILWEYPSQGGDWFVHAFEIPWAFANGNWQPPTERPMLFSLLILGYHTLLDTSLYSYWVSQLISVVANSAFIVPAFLIAYAVFGRKVGRASILFLSVNPFFFYQSIYTWPKNLAAYFILVMIYFLFLRQEKSNVNLTLAGIFAAAAYLAHPLSIFFVFATLVGLAFQRKIFCKGILRYFVSMGLILFPYFAWLYNSYGTIFTSHMMIYPFMTLDWTQVVTQRPEEIYAAFWSIPWWRILTNRLYNIVSTLTDLVARDPVWNFYDTYPSVLTFPVYVLAIIGVVKNVGRRTQAINVLLLFVFIPFVLLLLFWGWPSRGLVGQGLHTSAVILIMLAFNELFQIKDGLLRKTVGLSTIAYVLLQVVSVGYYVNRYYQASEKGRYLLELGRSWHYVANFEMSRFLSAHFLLDGHLEVVVSFLLVATIVVLTTVLLLRSEGIPPFHVGQRGGKE